jgi:predicted DCC family thiol-disulfide oxidoreductase YuxK
MDQYIATRQELNRATMRASGAKAAVFYDGQCPMCSREIAHYRRLRGAEQLAWIDITQQSEQVMACYGLDIEKAMARFHVCDASGRFHTGAWGFAELWSHLPYYRWLSTLLRKTRLLPMIDRGYSWFAKWRLSRQCSNGLCKT